MRQPMLRFLHRGKFYTVADRGAADPTLEPMSSEESAWIVRELVRDQANEVLRELSRMYGPARGLLRELEDHASWTDGGTCRVEFFRSPRNPRITVPKLEPPVDLVDLGPDDEGDVEHWIEVELQDTTGAPVRGFPVDLDLPSGGRVTKRTNLFGFARIDGISRDGSATVYLPELDPDDRPATPEPVLDVLRFEVVDDAGPRAGLELVVTSPDGVERDVTTDADGCVELPEIAAGNCTIRARAPATE